MLLQVSELQAEVENLKIKYAGLSRETRLDQNEKDVEVQKVLCLFLFKTRGMINNICV